jgi:N-ethylmaleimide reductase
MSASLFAPFDLGSLRLSNRIVMAPMTRNRATPDHLPTDLMALYYSQRAAAGLIVTEGTSPSPDGLGYARIPGLHSAAQAAAWRLATDAVHAVGGHIFVQLMHTGRVAHSLNLPAGAAALAPSAVGMTGTIWTDQAAMQPHPVPVAMTERDIDRTVGEFAAAAALAVEAAGFDGVELHGANGYLIDQFLNAASNHRADGWGGTIDGRARFAVTVAEAVASRIGGARTGIRLSPYGAFNDMQADAETAALYAHLAARLADVRLAYVHVVDHSAMGAPTVPDTVKQAIRAAFGGPIILSGGYDRARAEADLAAGKGELVAFGRPFIANPDLVARLERGLPLSPPDPDTFYTPGPKGYTDYAAAL